MPPSIMGLTATVILVLRRLSLGLLMLYGIPLITQKQELYMRYHVAYVDWGYLNVFEE